MTQSFADDLDAYRAAGADGIGIWEMKLAEDSLERFRASGLGAAAAVPAVPSILPLALMEGPGDPGERIDAICGSLHRLARFGPGAIVCLTGPGDDRDTVVDGLRVTDAETVDIFPPDAGAREHADEGVGEQRLRRDALGRMAAVR